MSDVPIIYNHNRPQPKLGLLGRLIGASLSVGALAALVVASLLEPSPSGVETHRQLGLPPCGMLQTTGVPCMTCGMTTSFAHLVRGDLWQSLVTQPGGTALALIAAVTFWAAGYVAVTGRPSARLLELVPWTRILFTLLGLVLAAWAYKIIVTLR